MPSEKESLTLLQFPVGKDREPITVIEVGPSTHACPNGLCKLVFLCIISFMKPYFFYFISLSRYFFYFFFEDIIHMTSKQYTNAVDDLKVAVEKLLNTDESDGLFDVSCLLFEI